MSYQLANSFTPDEVGEWQIKAEYAGSKTLKASQRSSTFKVVKGKVATPVVKTVSVEAEATSLTADGTSITKLTISLKDTAEQVLSGQTVTLSTDIGTVSTAKDNGDGTYTATYTSR